jgi:hypothetical protein
LRDLLFTAYIVMKSLFFYVNFQTDVIKCVSRVEYYLRGATKFIGCDRYAAE